MVFIILPLLKNKHGDATNVDMCCLITISSVISKVFESVLLNLYADLLHIDPLCSVRWPTLAAVRMLHYSLSSRKIVVAGSLTGCFHSH